MNCQDFLEFVNESGEDGFMVFSVGSIVSGFNNMDLTESIALLLSRLPQRVVWKHVGATPTNIGSNTKIASWIPQTALLGISLQCCCSYYCCCCFLLFFSCPLCVELCVLNEGQLDINSVCRNILFRRVIPMFCFSKIKIINLE